MWTQKRLVASKIIAFIIVTAISLTAVAYFPNIPPFLRPLRTALEIDMKKMGSDGTVDKRFMEWFSRDPERNIPGEPNILIAPADGVVELVAQKNGTIHVVIEMRYTDVHVQRVPIAGKVLHIEGGGEELQEGYNLLDYELEKMLPFQKITTFETEIGIVKVRQITSFFATRIKVYVEEGKRYNRGDRLGFVLAGSTVVVEVPDHVTILVKRNDEVLAGESIIGRYAERGVQ